MQIHEKLKQYQNVSPTPVLDSASCLAEDVSATYSDKTENPTERLELRHVFVFHLVTVVFLLVQLTEELQNGALDDDERELLLLLTTPHLKVPEQLDCHQ